MYGVPLDQTLQTTIRSYQMGDGALDSAKGKVKKAAGDVSGDKGLKREGKVDEATGTVKDKVGDASDKAKDVVGKD
jgi:uncharacterized protein YjbJ (UPF0337 family)